MPAGMSSKQWFVLLLTAGLFGSSFFFIKLAVDGIPPLTIAAARAALAAIAVCGFMRLSGRRLPKLGREWGPLIVLGMLTAAIPYAAVAWGQARIDSSLGGILFATIPAFSVLIAPLMLGDEGFTAERLLGAAIGFGGVVLVVGPTAFSGMAAQALGAVVTVIAAFSYATGGIYARRHPNLSPVVMAAGQLVIGSAILIPLSLIADAPWTLQPSTVAIGSLITVALFSTAVPSLLLFWLVRNAGATNASLLAFFMPVAAVLLGVGLLGEQLSWSAIAGFGSIILGATIVTGNIPVPRLQSS